MDALAWEADEGRGKLRKAAERRKQPLTRRYPIRGNLTWVMPGRPILNQIGMDAGNPGN